jgi:hypothetical protein
VLGGRSIRHGTLSRIAEHFGEGYKGLRDGRVPDDFDDRRRQHGFDEDLQRPAGQAGVDDDLGARRVRELRPALRQDPQEQRLPAPQRAECRRTQRAFRARSADESVDRAVAVHDRLVAGARGCGRLGSHHACVDERYALLGQFECFRAHRLGLGHLAASFNQSRLVCRRGPAQIGGVGRPCIASQTRDVSGMSRAGFRKRVDHRVDDRRRRADGRRLADALGADRMMRRRRDGLAGLPVGHSSAVGIR